jgi:hypothetical protein
MTRTTIILGALLVLLTAADAAVRPKETVGTAERALCGEWRGGACQGTWTFRADGTFELKHYSPGNDTLSGTWGIGGLRRGRHLASRSTSRIAPNTSGRNGNSRSFNLTTMR